MEMDIQQLLEAAGTGDVERVRQLINGGEDVNAADRHGWTPLLAAVEGRHVGVVKLLLESGADVHHTTSVDDMNALHILAEQGQRDYFASDADEAEERKAAGKLFDMLLNAGVDPAARNQSGETVLHLVCLRGNIVAAKDLLSRKLVDVNATNRNGDTALHYATRKGYREIVDLLVAHGASATVEGAFGTPTQVAREYNQQDIAQLLRDLALSSSSDGQLGLWSLPPEVVVQVLSYVANPRDLCAVSQVCRAFAAVSRDNSLWRPLGNPEWAQSGLIGEQGWKGAYLAWLRAAVKRYRVNQGVFATPVTEVKLFNSPDFDYLVKVLLVGNSGVGKSSLLLRYTEDKFIDTYLTTIGIDFRLKIMEWDGKRIKFQIWDTAGPERFRTITSSYYRGTHVILLMYDTTDAGSARDLQHWKKEIELNAKENVRVVMVGTKIDRADKREVREEEVLALAHEWGMPLVETSAKTGEGVSEVFNMVADQAMGGYRYVPGMGIPNYVPDASEMAHIIPILTTATTSDRDQARESNKDKDQRCCVQ